MTFAAIRLATSSAAPMTPPCMPAVMLFIPHHRGASPHPKDSLHPEWAEKDLRAPSDAVIAPANSKDLS